MTGTAPEVCWLLVLVCLVYGPVKICDAQTYGASTPPLTGEDLFKSLLRPFAQSVVDIRASAAQNRNITVDNSTGFFLATILSIDDNFATLAALLNGVPTTDTPAKCLAVISKIARDMNASILHRNDAILGDATGKPLVGEQLYQQQLQTIGLHFYNVLQAGGANANTPNPGKWLSIVLGWTQDYKNVQAVTANNDVTLACKEAALHIANDSASFLDALN
ncbi:hypothetical protein BV898_10668 [Hypsibius exemplaris]|uniref:Uncharacterized protein n=1 Tax=Hypsibius exemplaris TaxID=2072580 RepID=A0A1W0WIW7_HYPEX|nr:hypothetical protein BV898_10668 [Hypsibius exemplaris]